MGETFLLIWAVLATCGIGYFHGKASQHRKRARDITFMLCEVACGDVKPKVKDGVYTIETEDITFKFGRKDR